MNQQPLPVRVVRLFILPVQEKTLKLKFVQNAILSILEFNVLLMPVDVLIGLRKNTAYNNNGLRSLLKNIKQSASSAFFINV